MSRFEPYAIWLNGELLALSARYEAKGNGQVVVKVEKAISSKKIEAQIRTPRRDFFVKLHRLRDGEFFVDFKSPKVLAREMGFLPPRPD